MAAIRRAGSVNTYSSTSYIAPVVIPSAAVVGDIAIISIYTDALTAKPNTPPGWTKLGESDGTYAMNLFVFWKVITATDPGATVNVGPYSSGSQVNGVVYSIEVWSGAVAPPTIASARSNTGTAPSLAAAAGSIPLYVTALYDDSPNAPSGLTAPSGLSGAYKQGSSPMNGLGLFYGNPITGTTIPSQAFSGTTAGYGLFATIALPPATFVILAGAQAGADQIVTPILAGANAASDTKLMWTP
jgi:hypothetical protein